MTRDNLRPLEGQLVHYLGRLTECRPVNSDGSRDYMLAPVKVSAFSLDRPINLSDPAVAWIDHCWLRYIVPPTMKLELLEQVHGLAKVGWYRRSDGSVDLGLEAQHVVNINTVWSIADSKETMEQTLLTFEAVLKEAAEKKALFVSTTEPPRRAHKNMLRYINWLRRSVATQHRIERTARRGPTPIGPGSFRDLLQRAGANP